MRLDRFLSECKAATRKEAARAARQGGVLVNGVPVRDASVHIIPEADEIVYLGNKICYKKFLYIMLHKPTGYVSATEDSHLPCVTELLAPEHRRFALFPVGRLDKDTTGILLLTNDGALAHALLSPRHHVQKEYAFTLAEPLVPGAEQAFAEGLTLGDGECCKPCTLQMNEDRLGGHIILTEGKYHQIKRMMGAMGNRIQALRRVRFAAIALDPALAPGASRELTEAETDALRAAAE